MRHARRRLMLLAACLGMTALTGCAGGAAPAAGGQPSAATSQPASAALAPQGVNVAAFHALARHEASDWPQSPLGKVWKTSLVIPGTDDLTYVGNPRGFPSEDSRQAFGNGNLVFTGPPPSGAPAAVITWTNGAPAMKVPTLSAAQTFIALKNNTTQGRCPGCKTTPLTVTFAQPDTTLLPTSRGDAVVPAWAFTLPVLASAIQRDGWLNGSRICLAA